MPRKDLMPTDPIMAMADMLLRVVIMQGLQASVWIVLATPVAAILVYWHAQLIRRR
jgi:hypothetical protein